MILFEIVVVILSVILVEAYENGFYDKILFYVSESMLIFVSFLIGFNI